MLYLIEARCKGWEHEQVNAGFARQLRLARPDEPIRFYADAEHLRCVNAVLSLERNRIEACPTAFPSKYADCEEEARHYTDILARILDGAGPGLTDVILLSCCEGIALAVAALASRYPVQFHLTFHARLERMLRRERQRAPAEPPTRLRAILEQPALGGVSMICYSPWYARYLEGYLAPECLARMYFLHHPYAAAIPAAPAARNVPLRVGIYAAAANDNACRVVAAATAADPRGTVQFLLLGGGDAPLARLPGVERVLPGQRLTSGQIDAFVQRCDWLLVPYDSTQYHITASGVFWDALRNRTPVFALDAPYFRYYADRGFGVVEDSPEALARAILRQAACPGDFSSGIDGLLRDCLAENLTLLNAHLHGGKGDRP